MSDDSNKSRDDDVAESLVDELYDLCDFESDSLSEAGLREIIKRYGLMPNNNLGISDYDFFRNACCNERIDEEIIQLLLEYFPAAIGYTDEWGWGGSSPLHVACGNKNVTLNIIQLLIDAEAESLRSVDNDGRMPLHILCWSTDMDEKAAIEILQLLLEKCPESIRSADCEGNLSIHFAALTRSPEFCRILIEAYPGSERIGNDNGYLPLHHACAKNSVPTVEYFYKLYPDAFNHPSTLGKYPIHLAIWSPQRWNNLTHVVDIVRFLLDCDANVKLQKINGKSLIHFVCAQEENDSNDSTDEKADIEILKLLLEKCPDLIRRKDDKGNLPIHDAAESRSPDFCRVLIEAYPESEQISNDDGNLPLHLACIRGTLDTVEYLYNLYPDAINHHTVQGAYPIHFSIAGLATRNRPTAAADTVQFLLDCDPNVKLQTHQGKSLLHYACGLNHNVSNIADLEMLKLLLEKCPESIRHTDDEGNLPIHYAALYRSPDFCRVLIEAYPGSEQISNDKGALPLHCACQVGSVATVEYLYNLYPDAINHTVQGGYAIHLAFGGLASRNSPKGAVDAADIVRFLLDRDPSVNLQKFRGASLLHFACRLQYKDSNIDAAVQVIKAIYDAYPEAIEDDEIARNAQHFHQRVLAFINGELVHTRKARNHHLMTTPDEIGQLPLHHALQNNVRLGSIKLLVKGNPSALRSFDNNGVIPLHSACQYHDSPSVVQHLLDLYPTTLRHEDYDNNTALHHACRGAKYWTIALLLERHDAVSVSRQNAQKKLPIDLLWESDEVEDRESVEYLESVFRLMKAYPEMLMNIGMQMRQRQRAVEIGKKRKFGSV